MIIYGGWEQFEINHDLGADLTSAIERLCSFLSICLFLPLPSFLSFVALLLLDQNQANEYHRNRCIYVSSSRMPADANAKDM
jgi:hypothetical protein